MTRVLPLMIFVLALAACAGPPVAEVPTPTPPPTATPVPTATPTPAPTATPAPTEPPTSADADAVADAIAQTAAADTYRIALLLRGSGGATGAAGAELAEILALEGEFAGEDYQFTASGFLATFLGADPTRGLQAARADGTSYVRGPLTFVGATEDAWYRLDATQAALAAPPVSASATLGLLVDADFTGFTAGQAAEAESQSCTPYTGGEAATVALLQSLSRSGLPAPSDPAQISAAESTILVCEDGYVHQLNLAFSGVTPGDPPAPFSYDIAVELDGFDEEIAIAPPANARDLPTGPLSPSTGPTP